MLTDLDNSLTVGRRIKTHCLSCVRCVACMSRKQGVGLKSPANVMLVRYFIQGISVDGKFVRLKETLMTSFPDLEVVHTDRKSDAGWTEKHALDSALLENPVTVLMYCLHVLNVNTQEAFPPTVLATVDDGKPISDYGRLLFI